MSDALDLIDATLEGRCACRCGQKLDPDGPSQWFAGQDCQMRYLQARAIRPHEIVPPPGPHPLLVPTLPLLPTRIRNAEELAAVQQRMREAMDVQQRMREAMDQFSAFIPALWAELQPVLDSAAAALRHLAEEIMPILRRLAPIVEAARRPQPAPAHRRHLHTAYHRRTLARRRKARR